MMKHIQHTNSLINTTKRTCPSLPQLLASGSRFFNGLHEHWDWPQLDGEKDLHTARFLFSAKVVIKVLFYRLSFMIWQIIRKECSVTRAQLEASPVRNEPDWKWAMCSPVGSWYADWPEDSPPSRLSVCMINHLVRIDFMSCLAAETCDIYVECSDPTSDSKIDVDSLLR